MKSFLRILKYALRYKKDAIANILFNITAILFSVASLAMIIPFLRLLFGKEKLVLVKPQLDFTVNSILSYFNYILSTVIVEHGKTEALLFICFLVSIIFLSKNLFRYLAAYTIAPLRNGVVRDIRSDLFQKILILPVSYFSEEKKGDIIARLTADVQEIEWSIISTLHTFFREPITIIAYLATMIYISPQLTLFVLILLPFTGLIIGRVGKTLKRQSEQGQQRVGNLLSIIDETLTGLRVIKGFNAETYQNKKFVDENDRHFNIVNKMLRRRDLSAPLSEFLAVTVVTIVLWFGGRMVLKAETTLSAEAFIGFIVIFSQLIPPAKSFSSSFYFIQKGLASVERIESILDADVRIKEKINPEPLKELSDKIEYRNVSFAYEDENVLNDINLTIEKGQIVALVGQSGAGKTTLADLLPRFYDPDKGAICIDGVDIREYSIKDLRSQMGIVTQDSILFNDTVFRNIAFGIDASEEDVIKAAKVANAHEFIIQMPDSYNTNIGDQGGKLSGGQRQRLSIARAVLKNPPILILDEATSALDSESEKLVQEALFELMKNRTAIVIAHRLSTIQSADKIVVMHEGEIVEMGNHNELSNRDGIYRKMVELQAF